MFKSESERQTEEEIKEESLVGFVVGERNTDEIDFDGG